MSVAAPSLTLSTHKGASPEYPLYDCQLQRADQIAKYLASLARVLSQAPLFNGKGANGYRDKVIALAEYGDARIWNIFNSNATQIPHVVRWCINSFGIGNAILRDRNGNLINQGIDLSLSDDKPKLCSPEALEASYDLVFSEMITGWVKADAKDHPDILQKENPDEFDLFMKEKPFAEEDTLIRFIASRFSFTKDITCYTARIRSFNSQRENPYMWIRKSALPKVVETMGFRFESK